MNTKANVESDASIEEILDVISASTDPIRATALKSYAREMLSRATPDFFVDRSVEEIAELVTSVFEFLEMTPPGEFAVRVQQRPDFGHWGSVEVVIGDRPFVVDTVRQYLTCRGFEIRHHLHPVVCVDRDEGGKIVGIHDWRATPERTSVMYTEFEGHLDPALVHTLEEDIRLCMDDLRLATDDFQAMLRKTDEAAAVLRGYAERGLQPTGEIEEIVAFLEWLRDGGFVFLGYREYDLTSEPGGRKVAALLRGSGLGILRREEDSASWEPIPVDELPADLRARALYGPLLLVSKANSESRVHRRARMDYVGIKKLDDSGEVVGELRFLGLFTWQAYAEKSGNIPILRRKLRAVVKGANVPEGSHDHKTIVALFNDMPLEELFLVSIEDLRKQIAAVTATEDTGDVRMVLSPDALGRGVNVMVILPKRNYSDEVRGRLRSEIAEALGGNVLNDHLSIGAGDTARLHFYISASPERVERVDVEALKRHVSSIVRTWKQRLRDALEEQYDAEYVHQLVDRYFEAFSPAYVATVDVERAVEDIERLEALRRTGLMQVSLEDHTNDGLNASDLRLLVKRGSMILADAMPVLENLGLRVIDADAVDIGEATIHKFVVQGPELKRLDPEEVGLRLTNTLRAIAAGRTDSDPFNRLVITAGLSWPEVTVLRAYSAYAFQVGAVTSRRAAPDALTSYPNVARLLFEVFQVKFDPDFSGDRPAAVEAADSRFRDSLQAVDGIGDDLTLRRLHNLIEATVRTSYFKNLKRELPVPRTTFKFDCAVIQQMPQPRPAREMFVHGPRTAALHLRFGPVARGGLRWSERPDDFRTEVLGLVKTQQVKNTVIVPCGAKGAFYVRKPPADRAALKSAVRDCYADFVSGLLDVVDDIVDGSVVHPPDIVVYDDEDPYLVVAADKGTATFSDTANEISAAYDFWLGDAFASGGSHGYDHKKEAITARGAWESVRHHFREMGKDVNAEPVTVVGIGDMSGDVFGNGMLLSRTIKLLAAFDHRHIFIDPDPDPARSYEERLRLFRLPTSSWEEYDRSVISKGGGVFPRGAKEIELSPEIRELLGIKESVVNGHALIKKILRAPAELLWNGGIGTYVKAPEETHADVGDSSNDAVRIDANELRVKVVGEGGNLGLTQRARIDYALDGGRLNTDAIDNSGGVDMSDHEVNLKILLRAPIDRGEMSQDDRNNLLVQVKDDVAEAVLAHNGSQSLALSLEQIRAGERLSDFRDASYYLEHRAGLKRAQEFLPGWGRLQARQESGKSLARPELAVLLAYAKMHLKREILESALPDDPALLQLLRGYFPAPVVERVDDGDLRGHRLQRDIIATVLTNRLIDLMGVTFIPRVSRDAGATAAQVARGWYVASEIAGASELVEGIERNRAGLPAEQEYRWLLALEGVLDRTVRWAVENLPEESEVGGVIEQFKGPIAELCEILPSIVQGSQQAAFEEAFEELRGGGVTLEEAQKIASLQFLGDLMAVTRIAQEIGRPVADVGRIYFALADEIDFALLQELLNVAPGEDEWEQRAAQGLMQDLGQARRNLTLAVLRGDGKHASIDERLSDFRERNAARLSAMHEVVEELLVAESINLAALTVATRETVRQSTVILEGRL
ncbi:MAG: NAD-glutamate dehydrogenase domain-containing protein [Gemmatimonadota bacterium]